MVAKALLLFGFSLKSGRCRGKKRSSPRSGGNFGLGVLARGLCLEAGPSLVFLIQILSDGGHLPAFEFGHLDGPPALGGADHGAEHQLEHGLLAEGVGDDLQAPALLDEQTLEEVRNRYEDLGAEVRPRSS